MSRVRLTLVGDELEAAVVCGMLRADGIECDYRKSDLAAAIYGGVLSRTGPTEILVEERQLQKARELFLDSQ